MDEERRIRSEAALLEATANQQQLDDQLLKDHSTDISSQNTSEFVDEEIKRQTLAAEAEERARWLREVEARKRDLEETKRRRTEASALRKLTNTMSRAEQSAIMSPNAGTPKRDLVETVRSPQSYSSSPRPSPSVSRSPKSGIVGSRGSGKVILIMTVDIGDGRVASIEVKEFSNHYELAREFCVAHSLPKDVIGPLSLKIKENVQNLKEPDTQSVASTKTSKSTKSKYSRKSGQSSRLDALVHDIPLSREKKRKEAVKEQGSGTYSPTILSRSRKMAQNDGGTVFDRLYQTSRNRPSPEPIKEEQPEKPPMMMSKKSRELVANYGAEFDNYGERLYQQGVQLRKTREQQAKDRAERKSPIPTSL
ncbi:hypothetical protein GEMRC1_004119 [Eukaryota sp. GEM-RC1]